MRALPFRLIIPLVLAGIAVLLGLLGYFELVNALLERIGTARP